MGRGAVRWIAIALVGAMIAAVGVGLVTGREAGDGAADVDRPDTTPGAFGEPVDGPHLWLDLCAGVACEPLDDAGQQALVAEVDADPRVASTLFVPSDQAYQLFLDRYGDDEDLVASVRPEDMPARIEVELLDPAQVEAVMADYQQRQGVARVNDARAVTP